MTAVGWRAFTLVLSLQGSGFFKFVQGFSRQGGSIMRGKLLPVSINWCCSKGSPSLMMAQSCSHTSAQSYALLMAQGFARSVAQPSALLNAKASAETSAGLATSPAGGGSDGDSIVGGPCNDDKAALKVKHDQAGIRSMANSGEVFRLCRGAD